MKHVALAAVVLSAGLTAGCSELLSLNAFVTEEEAVMDRSILGVWTDGDSTFAIREDGKGYSIRYFEKGPHAIKFQARMVKGGDAKLLDVVEESEDPFTLPLHFLVRVWTEGNTLTWAFLDSDSLKDKAGRAFATHKDDKRAVLTASGTEWRDAVRKLAADESAYKGRNTLTKAQ